MTSGPAIRRSATCTGSRWTRVKIDRSFLAKDPLDPSGSNVLAAVVSLAQNLGKGVIVEGIETAEQVERLRKLRCPHAQGFTSPSRWMPPKQARSSRSRTRAFRSPSAARGRRRDGCKPLRAFIKSLQRLERRQHLRVGEVRVASARVRQDEDGGFAERLRLQAGRDRPFMLRGTSRGTRSRRRARRRAARTAELWQAGASGRRRIHAAAACRCQASHAQRCW